jgi:Flp pilus assembly pilin Flp
MHLFVKLFQDDSAATAVEYAVIIGLILLVMFSAIAMLGTKTSDLWQVILSGIRAFGM